MRYILVAFVLGVSVSHSYADDDCPTETFSAWGHTYSRGLIDALSSPKDCAHQQPAWLAKMNDTATPKAAAQPGLTYCRQIAQTKDGQNEAQRRDCIYWYGHSIEVK